MIGFKPLSAAFLLSFAGAQILNPPANVSSGYVRPSGPQALSIGQPDTAQQVSWFFTPNGLAVVDGDIIYGRIEDFNRALVKLPITRKVTSIPPAPAPTAPRPRAAVSFRQLIMPPSAPTLCFRNPRGSGPRDRSPIAMPTNRQRIRYPFGPRPRLRSGRKPCLASSLPSYPTALADPTRS